MKYRQIGHPIQSTMEIPDEYRGREQSYLKHRVLREYLRIWGLKLGSLAQTRAVRLWYVDCFSGPWKSQSQNLEDTSIHIGLECLEEAVRIWQEKGYQITAHAIFVEKERQPFEQLKAYLDSRGGTVQTAPLFGEFGDHTEEIRRRLGDDPAFIFVDPTGFKGVAMQYIARLVESGPRDVLINVMYNHINRFKDDDREFLRTQFREFFGVDDQLAQHMTEDELMRTYRENLKRRSALRFAADIAIPHPTNQRTWFRLVVGGKVPIVLEVFRKVEEAVMGREAAKVRTWARDDAQESRSGQMSLLDTSPDRDPWYVKENEKGRLAAMAALFQEISARDKSRFESIWPKLLEEHHITKAELVALVVEAARRGELRIDPQRSSRRTVDDKDTISSCLATPRHNLSG